MFLSQCIHCKNFSTRTTGREAILVTGVNGVMLQQNANFGHSNVISVVALTISKQFADENEYVQKLEEASQKNEYTLFNLFAHIDSPSPYLVTLHVDGVPLQMEIDTGSLLSLISESTFWRLWPNRTLENSLANLMIYSGAQLSSTGYSGCPRLSS